ncbi:type VI secretion system lipoprotein TssJ [Pseudoduganella albidiflava]|uniref:Type VI secretion system lipoprotein TssJ n=1 Tax=Pseudoduganella albidiflava TaxID=321983 RepID=A0A411WV48_9BURK|nr:type VI secretion system lipoprotein TssJ [Pseudoduganella albidiflava]QBI00509.1 type VI secretion system lipoprotein TssJ [Pseudoduganella albidiflava]GGY32754.1 type VI secretion system-associated lipoprotein [Pseudoduganella albidiflava]
MKATACIAAAVAVATLGGCTGASIAGAVLQIAGVNRPPEQPEAQKPPRNVNIRLHAAPTLNSGNGGPPLALVARVYTLRQAEAFERLSYAAYAGSASMQAERELLGADLLEVKEVLLIPGQRYEVTEKVSREAGYVGVVALFRAPDGKRWRAAFPAIDAEKSGITLGLHACAMTVGQGAAARQPQVARPLLQSPCT